MNNDQTLIIRGDTTIQDTNKIQALYLMVNNNPISKLDEFQFSESNNMEQQTLEWRFGILKNYLPEGCSQISINGVTDSELFAINDKIEVCNNLN